MTNIVQVQAQARARSIRPDEVIQEPRTACVRACLDNCANVFVLGDGWRIMHYHSQGYGIMAWEKVPMVDSCAVVSGVNECGCESGENFIVGVYQGAIMSRYQGYLSCGGGQSDSMCSVYVAIIFAAIKISGVLHGHLNYNLNYALCGPCQTARALVYL